ncbi:MAG: thioredoxin domain-containing protein, partial [Acidimicrobiaceae bacterium]
MFVNLKVDREERPDIDALYMDAVQAMSGRGGWPMTVFMSPEGHPFYGGTYFPKPSFIKLMNAVSDAWHNRRADIENNIAALGESLSRTAAVTPDETLPSFELITRARDQLINNFDHQWGGFGSAPKFPSTMNIDLLLRSYIEQSSDNLKTVVTTTLDAMASGGMYDHIGGGFSRYSVDEKWLVPHFEKMLYDQALLLR